MTRVPLPHDLRYHFRTRSPASPLRQLGGARIGTLVMAESRRPRAGGRTPGRRTPPGSRYSPLPLGPEDGRMKRALPRELDDLSGCGRPDGSASPPPASGTTSVPMPSASSRTGPSNATASSMRGSSGRWRPRAGPRPGARPPGRRWSRRPRVAPSTSSSWATSSRFLRNLEKTLIAVEDHLHTAGVVVLFADERLLSSDPGSWDQFIREAHEAEA